MRQDKKSFSTFLGLTLTMPTFLARLSYGVNTLPPHCQTYANLVLSGVIYRQR